jgi:hypothetical protein
MVLWTLALSLGAVGTQAAGPPTGRQTPPPVAHAGDDQVGLVGHRVTLNGSDSQPRSEVSYRWIPTQGPAPTSPEQDGYIYSFLPSAPGLYRFALVVADHQGTISEPDFVEVLVGTTPPTTPYAQVPRSGNVNSSVTPAFMNASSPEVIEALARSAVLSVEGGPALAESLAVTFEGVAQRIDLYSTYADVFQEMSTRLGSVIPQDPAQRAVWIQRLFTPLTARLVEKLRAEGLDLLKPGGTSSPLSPEQKAVLSEVYRAAASGFRAVAQGVGNPG